MLVLRAAQRAHERGAARRVQGARALQGRKDSSRHLRAQRRRAAGRPRPLCPGAASLLPGPLDPARRPAVVERGAASSEGPGLGAGVPGAGRTGRRRAEGPDPVPPPSPPLHGSPGRSVGASYPTPSLPGPPPLPPPLNPTPTPGIPLPVSSGRPQPTPLLRRALPGSRAVPPSTFPRLAPAASRRKPGRISALAAAVTQGSGYGHGRGHCTPRPEEERRQRAAGKDPAGQGFEVRTGPRPR